MELCWKDHPINFPLSGGTLSSLILGHPLKNVAWGLGSWGDVGGSADPA